jgi:hypothetical protein
MAHRPVNHAAAAGTRPAATWQSERAVRRPAVGAVASYASASS